MAAREHPGQRGLEAKTPCSFIEGDRIRTCIVPGPRPGAMARLGDAPAGTGGSLKSETCRPDMRRADQKLANGAGSGYPHGFLLYRSIGGNLAPIVYIVYRTPLEESMTCYNLKWRAREDSNPHPIASKATAPSG